MRHRFAIALAPLALLACSSAGEPVGIDQSASTWCPIDYVYECHEVVGRRVCDCVYVPPPPPPPVCNYVVNNPPPSPGISLWIAAWAVQSWGQCNDIPGNGGTWKDLVPVGPLYANCFNGVPNEYLDPAGAPSCRSQFPGGNCCTYVWWPDTFVEPTSCPPGKPNFGTGQPVQVADAQPAQAPQDTLALCKGNTWTWYALEDWTCDESVTSCPLPGGGTCDTCSAPSLVH